METRRAVFRATRDGVSTGQLPSADRQPYGVAFGFPCALRRWRTTHPRGKRAPSHLVTGNQWGIYHVVDSLLRCVRGAGEVVFRVAAQETGYGALERLAPENELGCHYTN